jgi:hypothetical protein
MGAIGCILFALFFFIPKFIKDINRKEYFDY